MVVCGDGWSTPLVTITRLIPIENRCHVLEVFTYKPQMLIQSSNLIPSSQKVIYTIFLSILVGFDLSCFINASYRSGNSPNSNTLILRISSRRICMIYFGRSNLFSSDLCLRLLRNVLAKIFNLCICLSTLNRLLGWCAHIILLSNIVFLLSLQLLLVLASIFQLNGLQANKASIYRIWRCWLSSQTISQGR